MTAGMAATPVATNVANASANHLDLVTGRSVPVGNTLLLSVNTSANIAPAPTFTVTATGGLTWIQDAARFNDANHNTVWFSARVTASTLASSTTITVSIAGADANIGRWAGQLLEATGLLQASGYTDLSATAQGTTSSVAPLVSSTPTANVQADELLAGSFTAGVAPTFTPAAGMTAMPVVATTAATANKQSIVVYKVLSGPTAVQTVGGTFDTPASWTGALVSYKGVPAAPTPTTGRSVRRAGTSGTAHRVLLAGTATVIASTLKVIGDSQVLRGGGLH